MRFPIYLDYMATTPVDLRVAERMMDYLTSEGHFGNPSSRTHIYGKMAAEAVEQARQQVASLLGCMPEALIWTSGATEANNLAIKGAARFYHRQGRHIITVQTEHKAVLEPCAQLEREGFEVTYLPVQPNGLIDISQFEATLRPDTILVSIMHANNEIGVIQDMSAISKLTHDRGIVLHVDAAQSAGKIPIDLSTLPIDLLSVTAHKVYGPKGIGALYIRQKPRLHLEPLIQGGGQERGLRGGTLAVHQIVGMGEAFELAKAEMLQESQRLLKFRDNFLKGLQPLGDQIHVQGDLTHRLPGNLSLSFKGVPGQMLIENLPELAVSSSAACSSGNLSPSHVLSAIRVPQSLLYSTLRFSFGRFTTEEEVRYAAEYIVEKMKNSSSLVM